MIIGFIGFGRVSSRLNDIFTKNNFKTITSTENRSKKTIQLISNANINVLETNLDVAQNSDILISANSPKQALNVAEQYASETKGIYLDLNNISPKTTLEIANLADNFVDGAIIGKIEEDVPILFLAGEKSKKLNDLLSFLNIFVISNTPGDVAILKLLRSTYTKAIAGVLIESLDLANSYNLKDEFIKTLLLTEGELFKKNKSRVRNTLNYKNHKIEEVEEILDFFNNNNLTILKAVLEKFKDL